MLRDALKELNRRFFPGARDDKPAPGGVSWWFKQDEIHQATHVHDGPEFLPWHREIVNRLEEMLRQINPKLSLHYWDWTQDPRAIPNANLGGGVTGTLNLFTPDFMGYGGLSFEPSTNPGSVPASTIPRPAPLAIRLIVTKLDLLPSQELLPTHRRKSFGACPAVHRA